MPLQRPDPETLDAWMEGRLDDAEAAAVEAWFEAHPEELAEAEMPTEFLVRASQNDVPEQEEVAALVESLAKKDPFFELEGAWLDLLSPTDQPGCLGLLGGYEVLEVIATGGMATVLKARDPELDRFAAIKILAPTLAANGMARKRFLREARAVARLEHPHILPIYEVRAEETPWFAMRYVEGGSLQDRLNSDDEGLQQMGFLTALTEQMASALELAHDAGLVHRDLKPANVLLEPDGDHFWLTDFGIARFTDDPDLTYPGVIAGTPRFMSPEQAAGEGIDHRSDFFSLGGVLFRCATGQELLEGSSSSGVLKRLENFRAPAVQRLNSKLEPWFSDLIGWLLSPERDDRPGHAGEILTALKERRRIHKPRWSGYLALVAGVSLVVFFLFRGEPEKPSVALLAEPTTGAEVLPQGSREPVVYSQATIGVGLAELEREGKRWIAEGYHPVRVHNHWNGKGKTLHSVVWHKDDNVIKAASLVGLTLEKAQQKTAEFEAKGYRVAGCCGSSDGKKDRYSVVWLREREQAPHRAFLKQSYQELYEAAKKARLDGFSPLEIHGWAHAGETFFSSTWIKDRREFHFEVDRTGSEWEPIHESQRSDLNRSLRHLGIYRDGKRKLLRSSIWVDNPATDTHYRWIGVNLPKRSEDARFPRNDFSDHLRWREVNMRYDTISTYPGRYGKTQMVAMVRRVERPHVLRSSSELSKTKRARILRSLKALTEKKPGLPRIGFFLEDLKTEEFIAYNPHEAFYADGLQKLILATAFLKAKPDLQSRIQITPERFRDHQRKEGLLTKVDVGSEKTLGELLTLVLKNGDPTAADILAENGGSPKAQRKIFYQDLQTRNVGPFLTEGEKLAAMLSYQSGLREIGKRPAHLIHDWFYQGDSQHRKWDSDEDRTWFDQWKVEWLPKARRQYFASLQQTVTPRSYSRLLRAVASGDLLSEDQRNLILKSLTGPGLRLGMRTKQLSGKSEDHHCWAGLVLNESGEAIASYCVFVDQLQQEKYRGPAPKGLERGITRAITEGLKLLPQLGE